jgi:hypothetical protein
MPAPFKQITREQFAQLLASFKFTRKVNTVHMHHTWRPNHAQYRGHDSIVSMWEYHTKNNGWSDIAQHITIAPDGSIWLGRNWNQAPASASGHNGSAKAGPFMFEMIGDFDVGKDSFGGEQRRTAVEVIARIQMHFKLPPGALQFHNMMSGKTCPGSSINYEEVLAEVSALHDLLSGGELAARRHASPFSSDTFASEPLVRDAIQDLARAGSGAVEPFDASPCEYGIPEQYEEALGRSLSRATGWGPAERQELLPHIVNLRSGQFSSSGDWSSTAEDVDAIFDTYLPQALADVPGGQALPLVLYAHGGLTDEESGLEKARLHIQWWKQNKAYPIYFVWETGFVDTLLQLLERQQAAVAGARNLFSDNVGDPIIQALARKLGGDKIWGAMKQSAQLASAPNVLGTASTADAVAGGAYYLATRLAEFCRNHPGRLTLHAVGHSAGAVFHSHFVPRALELGVQPFRSMHLMAPAVRADVFKQQLLPLVGGARAGIEDLTMYTMHDSYERDDNCGAVYRKSLLYLIHYALEPDNETPILGLERNVRKDPALKNLFGIGGAGPATIIWSRTDDDSGRSASHATTHGGFDDDPRTMESIARRVLDLDDSASLFPYPEQETSRARALWTLPPAFQPTAAWPPVPQLAATQTIKLQVQPQRSRKMALCVGINGYPTAPLSGCVSDANSWSSQLAKLGFQCDKLLDQQATRAAIAQKLEQLVTGSRCGDVIVFQYSGHGTQVPDVNGDEMGGDSPKLDEAICPVDFHKGELLIDDDFGRIFAKLPDGVNLTCFFDCCHSGTISRMGVGTAPLPPGAGTRRARFVIANPETLMLYAQKRRDGARQQPALGRGLDLMREVVFSACLSTEVAWENNGQGDFTVRAMQTFGATPLTGLTNTRFADIVTANFGATPQQHARLYSSKAAGALSFLQPLASAWQCDEASRVEHPHGHIEETLS